MKDLKKMTEIDKTKMYREVFIKSFKNTTKELARAFVFGTVSVGLYMGIVGGISYLEKTAMKNEPYCAFMSENKAKCIKYVSRAGYFYCDTNKKVE